MRRGREERGTDYVVCGEEAGKQIPNETADGVDGEDVERVVDAEEEFDFGRVVAADAADDAVDDCGPGRYEATSWCDCDEAGDNTGAETDSRELAFEPVVDEAPCDAANRGGKVGNHRSHDCPHVR